MNEIEKGIAAALEVGFTHAVRLDVKTLTLLPEVRKMCAANSCGKYDRNWSCPPGCGTLEDCRRKVMSYRWGVLVQTVGELEDNLDYETMKKTEERHKKAFLLGTERLRDLFPGLLALGSGCCTLCTECTYPSNPCRMPPKRVSSLEAYGILVSDLCKKNNLNYYYGPNMIAYTSCYLLG